VGQRVGFAKVLRPLIFSVVSAVPLTTREVVEQIEKILLAQGAKSDFRGVLVQFPVTRPCRDCGHSHECIDELPIGTGIVKPQLDALARAGALNKYSRGTSRSAIWTLADIEVPNTPDELFKDSS
jgi:hypothetical protein